jgi:ribokinase
MANIVVVGSANIDLVLHVDALPKRGETISGSDIALFPGGKGANQACAAAMLGARTVCVARVGQDAYGAMLMESLRQAGVDTSAVGRDRRPTGCASIYVLPDGDNSIVISPGANASLDPETALSHLKTLSEKDLVLLQLEIPMETVEAVLCRCKQAGATAVLDPAPARLLLPEVLQQVDYLTPNQTEAAVLLGCADEESIDIPQAARFARDLRKLGAACVVLKLGELGCYVESGTESCHVPGFPVSALDTTGAGDVFNAAFAVALSEGKNPLAAAQFANAAAALSVTRHGAQTSIPRRDAVDGLLDHAASVVVA